MTPPVTRVNTFIQEKKNTSLDLISKIFIITELLWGVNRLPVLNNIKPIFITLSLILSLSVNFTVLFLVYHTFSREYIDLLNVLKVIQYSVCAILGVIFHKRLSNFYSELNGFDEETNFGGVNFKDVIKNVIQTCLTVIFIIILFISLHILDIFKDYTVELIIILLVHITELHFFGHLLNLLVPRLHFIGYLMNMSFTESGVLTIDGNLTFMKNRRHPPDIRKLMDYYHRIIVAFDTLNDAIKWQMLIILVTSFMSTLSLSYNISLQLIHDEYDATIVLVNVTLALTEMLPMFAPCRVVDAVHGEARQLTELLSSRLYENKIEKSSRAVAQALLALMEARDLSLSLLRIFDIDVSFPFKFLGLLVTYLIILLQFEKVINLEKHTT